MRYRRGDSLPETVTAAAAATDAAARSNVVNSHSHSVVCTHPFINPYNPKYRSYIDFCPKKRLNRRFVRYTPVTIRDEELIRHSNVDYSDSGIDIRGIEDMFDTDFYWNFFGGWSSLRPFHLRFVESVSQTVKYTIAISVGRGIQGATPTGFLSTLICVMRNVKRMCDAGLIAWDQIAVCVVVDGRNEFETSKEDYEPSFLSELQRMGVYMNVEELWEPDGELDRAARIYPEDRKAFKEGRLTVDKGQDVFAHLFESTIQMKSNEFPPLQLVLCVKEYPDQSSADPIVTSRMACHLWAIEGIARHFANVTSSRNDVKVALLDCGVCPDDNCLGLMYKKLQEEGVAVVGGNSLVTADHQIPCTPPLRILLSNPSLASWLLRQKIRLASDGAMDTGLGGNLSNVNCAMCALRLDRVDTDTYFTQLTFGGNNNCMNPLLANILLNDGGMMASSAHGSCSVVLLYSAKDNPKAMKKEVLERNAQSFTFTDLIEHSRFDTWSPFVMALSIRTLLGRSEPNWTAYGNFILLFIYRFGSLIADIFTLVALDFVMIVGLSNFNEYLQLPFACVILIASIVMSQLLCGSATLSRGVVIFCRVLCILLGVLWALGMYRFSCVLAHGCHPLVSAAFFTVSTSPFASLIFMGDLDIFWLLPLCVVQWFFTLPATTVVGSALYSVCMADILPWGTAGPDPLALETADTQARRMETRSWLTSAWLAANLLPIVAFTLVLGNASQSGTLKHISTANEYIFFGCVVYLFAVLFIPRTVGILIYAFTRALRTFGSVTKSVVEGKPSLPEISGLSEYDVVMDLDVVKSKNPEKVTSSSGNGTLYCADESGGDSLVDANGGLEGGSVWVVDDDDFFVPSPSKGLFPPI
ncbi:Chitin synthase, class 2 [Perkinsus chesapeaki]|uniref:Chitin synthase, class 2 n=1 Tax=Perkinsus chesapeaki TaxID=330153 RepID=A0A7J6MZL8_PERCH|nr:Chitin synthase, class 2 [Perkinsus chesapeaki]